MFTSKYAGEWILYFTVGVAVGLFLNYAVLLILSLAVLIAWEIGNKMLHFRQCGIEPIPLWIILIISWFTKGFVFLFTPGF